MTDVQTRPDAEITAAQPACGGAGSSRRVVLAGATALGAGCLLAACGTDTGGAGSNGSSGGDFSNNPAPAGSKGADTGSTSGGDSGGDSGGAALALVADIPEGGGIIKGDYVITQPASGTFKAFSKVCTHQGCDVTKVDGGVITCACHNSTFSIEDGAPTGGPAKKPLSETQVKVDGDNIVAA
ncbi:Rieske (2Fe-2S) protein [Actinoplanes auranticolor]|uniref:Cytochrome bc1 complex Rieske iron-sulfur subunit n=1 Tax=Actinoplanes auranticolor TaxID=47988 RepID=A0A919SSD9_9ACTN|nr:Rieske (2Fe-2S) protein [Actinoplanes auranticolor]GIM76701.1 iron-sulfur protein [Actinoplanes auranticolor]